MNPKPSKVAVAVDQLTDPVVRKPRTQVELFNSVAATAGKHTISQFMPSGEVLLWMTNDEVDPVRALMAAAVSIMLRRGQETNGVSIRKVAVATNGLNLYWSVMGPDGAKIADGYAKDETDAAEQMKPWMLGA